MNGLIILCQVICIISRRTSAFQFSSRYFDRNGLKSRQLHVNNNEGVTHLTALESMTTTSSFRNDPILLSPPALFSTNLWSEAGGYEAEDNELEFLPIDLYSLPPQTDYMLRRIVNAYIQSDQGISRDISLKELIDVIDAEYKYSPKPFSIGTKTFMLNGQESETEEETWRLFSKVVSFAALYSLPKEITLFLLQDLNQHPGNDDDVADEWKKLVDMFDGEPWELITFQQGLAIRVKREHLESRRERYSLIPRNSILSKSYNTIQARDAINRARMTKAPPKLAQNVDIVAEIDEIADALSAKSEFSQRGDTLINELTTFFPRENKILNFLARISRATSKKTKLLQSVGRAGLISYGVLNFLWYTLAIIWRWNTLTSAPPSALLGQHKVDAFRISIRKFA